MTTPLERARFRIAPDGLHADLPTSPFRGIVMLACALAGILWFVRFILQLDGARPILILVEVSIVLVGFTWGGLRRLSQRTRIAFESGLFRCVNTAPREEVVVTLTDLLGFAARTDSAPHVVALVGGGKEVRLPLYLGSKPDRVVLDATAEALDAMRVRASTS